MFRLHIDIPLDFTEEESIRISNQISVFLCNGIKDGDDVKGIKKIQYRLAYDNDRTIRNYLIKDENGHVSTKKSVIEL